MLNEILKISKSEIEVSANQKILMRTTSMFER
jgi:hypothetical protein